MANPSGSHQAPDAKRLKVEALWSASPFESAPQHLPPPQEVSGYANQYPPQHLQASSPYIGEGPSVQTLPPPQNQILQPQVIPNPYPPSGPALPHGSGASRTLSESSIAPLPPHLSSQHSHPQQHRRSIDERSHHQPLRPLAVPPHPQSFQRGHPHNSAASTPVTGTGQLVSPSSAGGNYGGGGSVNVTPVNPNTPMSFQPRQGSIHGGMETGQGGMLSHFQLGMGQNQNSSPSPVMGQNMGMGMAMYPQQPGQPGQVVTTYPPRRKAIRAAQACDACRARKAKCDEGRPSCGFCKETGVACIYREVPPPKQDRTLLEILNRLGNIEQILNRQEAAAGDAPPAIEVPPTSSTVTAAFQSTQPLPLPPAQDQLSERSAPRTMMSPTESRPLPGASMDDDDDDAGFPYHHTTAAHKLLLWPSIQRLVENDCGEWAEGYVHALEESRGNLKIWGRGEYLPASQHMDPNSWFEDGHDSPVQSNEGRKGAFSEWPSVLENSRPDSTWGNSDQTGQDTDNMNGTPQSRGYSGNSGVITGLAADGESLNFDKAILMRLLQSYLDNIHILHPILNRAIITKMVRVFSDKVSTVNPDYGTNIYSNQSGPSRNIPGDASPITPGPLSRKPSMQSITSPTIGKRKRTGSISHHPPTYGQQSCKNQRIPRTIHSAVVLLVMALGAVCLHRRPVPGPLPPNVSGQYLPPGERDIRNIDIIPGLAYFTKATEIIGTEVGANELENVQAGLLAGLYWGQLGRILDSWKWISWACLSCQVLVRSRMSLEKDDLRKELIRRAFWSCLQLESDVLAELDLPPSGISRLEDTVPFPGGEYTNEVDEAGIDVEEPNMIMYYLAQIALRKLLNRVHSELYKQRKSPTDITRSLNIAHELDFQLEQWKIHLPEPLRWDESDEPSDDINAARLRAKYFGARYIIHRPFVYLAIHGGPRPNFTNPQFNSPRVSQGDPGSQHPSPIQAVSTPTQPTFTNASARKASMAIALDEYTPSHKTTVEESCKKCLDAAVQSTRAFHAFSVSEFRPVITNVFGTAHAQFGNLLVLQAAFNSGVLKSLVDGQQLEGLFVRTLDWYRTLAPISPALKRDLHILEGVYSRAARS